MKSGNITKTLKIIEALGKAYQSCNDSERSQIVGALWRESIGQPDNVGLRDFHLAIMCALDKAVGVRY